MGDALIRALLAGALLVVAARVEGQSVPAPKLPTAGLPPPLVDLPGPTAARPEAKGKARGRPPKVVLVDRSETGDPAERGAARVEGGKAKVSAKGATLKATLARAATAHAAILCPGEATARARLVQVFDVEPGDPGEPRVSLTLSAEIDGYVRSEPKGTACLRTAAAAVYPAGGGPPLALALALSPACARGCAASRCRGEAATPPAILPAGRYVLVADLVLEASVEGACRGHAEADFRPEKGEATWDPEGNPLRDVDPKGFGFHVTVKAGSP